jgi:hypothetical protein
MNTTATLVPVAKTPMQPQPQPEPERDRIDLRVDPEIRERLNRQAERFGMRLSPYIRQAVIEKLERDEATDPERLRDE